MKDQNETQSETKEWVSELANFRGSQNYAKYQRHKLTDGAVFFAKKAECFWIYDVVTSVEFLPIMRGETFQVWEIKKPSAEAINAVIICTDGNNNVLYKQSIDHTTFPLKEFSFYCVDKVIMLKSEY